MFNQVNSLDWGTFLHEYLASRELFFYKATTQVTKFSCVLICREAPVEKAVVFLVELDNEDFVYSLI